MNSISPYPAKSRPIITASFGQVIKAGIMVTGISMAKTPKEVELHPDAWQRFERAAGVVAKSPPQHRVAKKKTVAKKTKAKKKRARERTS
jgi:hypothetical protein